MSLARTIFFREFKGYFDTPMAFIFIVVFTLLIGIFTFYLGRFFEQGNATLESFFSWHPWLYLFLMPAISMRLWAEERRLGTFELLMTFPITPWQAVWGKFLAAWCFALLTLSLTFPIWITVNYLGSPDNGVIIAGYIASILSAGCFLAMGSCISAFCRSQVIAFIVSVTLCFLCMVSGFPMVINFFESIGLPQLIIDTVSALSLVTNFLDMSKGLISITQIIYFGSFIFGCLAINTLAVLGKRG